MWNKERINPWFFGILFLVNFEENFVKKNPNKRIETNKRF